MFSIADNRRSADKLRLVRLLVPPATWFGGAVSGCDQQWACFREPWFTPDAISLLGTTTSVCLLIRTFNEEWLYFSISGTTSNLGFVHQPFCLDIHVVRMVVLSSIGFRLLVSSLVEKWLAPGGYLVVMWPVCPSHFLLVLRTMYPLYNEGLQDTL